MIKNFSKLTVAVVAASIMLASLWLAINIVKAADDPYGLSTAGSQSGLASNQISAGATGGSIPKVLGSLVSIALSLVGVYFFILILFAGFTWMTAAGSQEKVGAAKSRLQSAVIGLVIVLSAYTITIFIFDTFIQEAGQVCANTPDGVYAEECAAKGVNQVCKSKKCVSECDYAFKDGGGACIDTAQKGCEDKKIVTGLCSTEGLECCVPPEAYVAWMNSGAMAPKEEEGGAQEQNACEKQAGFFCAEKFACAEIHNGKPSEDAQGCPTGQICCKNCAKLGGTCIDTTLFTCDNASKNLKPGYCYGVWEKNNDVKCCLGTFEANVSDKYLK
ncbi:MAG: pilin [Candidatus Magasanikbacteria bacterium]|nr:pilin [Candidatus Magasanikbacteria bacterium]